MNKKLKNVLIYTISLGAAGFLLWLTFDRIEPPVGEDGKPLMSKVDFLSATLKQGSIPLLAVSALCAIVAHLIRAERWKILMDPLGYKLTLGQGFYSVMLGYFVNLLIPRGGEVSRSVAINRMNRKVPVDTSLGTIVAERIIDMLFLLVCIGIGFLVEFDKLSNFNYGGDDNSKGSSGIWIYLLIGFCALLGGVLLLYLAKPDLFRKIKAKMMEFISGLKEGMFSVFKLKKAGLFVLYSFLIWILYYMMTLTVLKAFPSTAELGPLAALSIFAIGGVAMAIPLPGGTGSYHFLVALGLTSLYGIDKSMSQSFVIIFHGWQTVIVILVGAFSLIMINRMAKNAKNDVVKSENITA